jgi:hypothetical protein
MEEKKIVVDALSMKTFGLKDVDGTWYNMAKGLGDEIKATIAKQLEKINKGDELVLEIEGNKDELVLEIEGNKYHSIKTTAPIKTGKTDDRSKNINRAVALKASAVFHQKSVDMDATAEKVIETAGKFLRFLEG